MATEPKVSACLVTRGNVDMQPILDSLPAKWETIVWDNSAKTITLNGVRLWGVTAADLSVYGRYAAINYATPDLIFCQDDDVIVSDPQAIVDAWHDDARDRYSEDADIEDFLVANMSEYHQLHHADAPLLGFGSCFHRDAPARAFARWDDTSSDLFRRTCDVVFAALTPSVVVNVPFEYLPQASAPDRMSRQAGFAVEREKVLDRVLAKMDVGL